MSIAGYQKVAFFQTSVYWKSPVAQNDGSYLFDDPPTEIRSLWQETKELIRDTDGREVASTSMVYVLEDLDDNGMLFLGSLTDLTTAQKSDPRTVTNAREIKKFVKLPSLYKKGEFSRIAKL